MGGGHGVGIGDVVIILKDFSSTIVVRQLRRKDLAHYKRFPGFLTKGSQPCLRVISNIF
jgi:hypothetical protein